MDKAIKWWTGEAQWWEIWKTQHGANVFFSGLMIMAIITILAYLWG